ncbi:hypothetical protein RclHR1_18440004 [Rhizophagus clarus]|uniref:Uncharacterized protein n=1 Tax=Rhizophagus clarus TaxID=94130 RepID=A0A2Z6QZU8_9GLOM|nr:hypothetical protein RclHR1_18440004 [Rhizophagus clarus]
MVTHLHEKFYQFNATPLIEADIKEIRESRGRILNASKKMAEKFHPTLDKNSQTDKTEQTLEVVSEVSSIPLPATVIPKKNGQKKKVKIDEKPITEVTSMVEKNNKNDVISSSDKFREARVESLLKNLVNRGEKLRGYQLIPPLYKDSHVSAKNFPVLNAKLSHFSVFKRRLSSSSHFFLSLH